jgi:hypothetical protein
MSIIVVPAVLQLHLWNQALLLFSVMRATV